MAKDPEPIDHIVLAISRLATQFRESTNFIGYIKALLVEANNLEKNLSELIKDRYLDTAYGQQLDVLGEIVDQPRELVDSGLFIYFGFAGNILSNPFGSLQTSLTTGGRFIGYKEPLVGTRLLSDDEYRSFIAMKIISNGTHSRPEEVIQLFKFLFGQDTLIILTEGPGTFYSVQIGRELTENEIVALNYFPIPKTVGVGAKYYSSFDTDAAFGFFGVPGSLGFGDWNGSVVIGGGKFSKLLF